MSAVGTAMRVPTILTLTLCLLAAGCGTPEPDADDLAGFVPPTLTRRDEALRLLDARFKRLDVDHDGAITAGELGPERAARLPRRDTDHDGRVTHDEFVATGLARFDRQDTNHDGTLTNTERAARR